MNYIINAWDGDGYPKSEEERDNDINTDTAIPIPPCVFPKAEVQQKVMIMLMCIII